MTKIARQAAVQDFEQWLDFRKVKEKKREESISQQEELISAIEEGLLVIDEDKNLILKLIYPITNPQGEVTIPELKFKPRLTVHELNVKLKGTSATSVDERIVGYAAALTGTSKNIIEKLDTEDYRTISSIVMYFL